MGRFKDITGMKFGKLTVVGLSHLNGISWFWACQCECGAEVYCTSYSLTSGHSKTCGCSRRIGFKESSKKELYYRYKLSSTNRNIEFYLTIEEFLNITSQNCYYCNAIPSHHQ